MMNKPIQILLSSVLAIVLLFPLGENDANAEGLLGGGAQQYSTLWVAPETASFSRFLFRTSTSIRYDLNLVLSIEQTFEKGYKEALLSGAVEGTLPNAALIPLPLLLEIYEDLPIAYFPLNFLPENINPEILESTIVEDELIGLPFHDGNHQLLYYNKKIASGPIADLTGLTQFHGSKPDNTIASIIWDYERLDVFCDIFPCTENMLPNEGMMSRSLSIFQKMIDESVISKACPTDCTEPRCFYLCMIEEFYNGKVAYMINGDWELSEALDHLGTDLGIAPVPELANAATMHFRYPNILVFFNDAFSISKKNTSLKLAYYLMNRVVQKRMFSDANRIPVNELYLADLYGSELIPDAVESVSIAIMQEMTTPLLSNYPQSRMYNAESIYLMDLFYKGQLLPLESASQRLIKTLTN